MHRTETALAQLMAIAARDVPDFLSVPEQPQALDTRFAAEDAATAAIAAGTVAAADLWELRTGARQRVTVNPREAAAAVNGFLYQQFDDATRAPERAGQAVLARTNANGFKRCGDGHFIYLHPSFPESTKKLLRVLDCEDTGAAVNATCLRWKAKDLEDAIAAAGACGAMARSGEEWDASEQGRILATRPVVEIVKIGDSPREPLDPDGIAPLSGMRVLDLTRVLAGPTCARTLAQYGAETMVISSPDLPSVPFFVSDTGHGKLAAFVDLKSATGADTLRSLVRGSDVFSQGYRQGALERLGFGPLQLAELRPGIIVTAINCYGHEGPWRGRPGWEQLGQTVTGLAVEHGGVEGPKLLPGAVTDYTTGFLAAFGSMIALQRRALYGGSYLVRVSLAQTGVWIRGLGVADAKVTPLAPDEIAAFRIRSEDTGFGPMAHLRPPAEMSVTPPRWSRGVAQLGTHPPVWPA
jgi:crotonobetainyl-CoA:carnitine CoA-transferase CaiB-like acyl-CoA transferase